ncbi:hypothetical protein [Thermococcus sp. Bubb.Bath]|uniref:hypothetical protein n=1 Tax=Thermococcus sp. Bubb.Bath TaxID=1638242 RepID=UPI001F0E5728|nr:hypothetical protein [Thermococcus sp. Bubb.Bath]
MKRYRVGAHLIELEDIPLEVVSTDVSDFGTAGYVGITDLGDVKNVGELLEDVDAVGIMVRLLEVFTMRE